MGIELLYWRIPFLIVELSTAKCQIKFSKCAGKKLGEAVRKCQRIFQISSDNNENCKVKCKSVQPVVFNLQILILNT